MCLGIPVRSRLKYSEVFKWFAFAVSISIVVSLAPLDNSIRLKFLSPMVKGRIATGTVTGTISGNSWSTTFSLRRCF